MPVAAKYLGFAGLIPFVGLPLLSVLGLISYYQSYQYFVQYSAIILSFFGGIHWLAALLDKASSHQIYVAMLPSIIAWLSLIFLSNEILLAVLSLSYIGMFIYDKNVLQLPKSMVFKYISLRLHLTSIAVFSHLFMAYLH